MARGIAWPMRRGVGFGGVGGGDVPTVNRTAPSLAWAVAIGSSPTITPGTWTSAPVLVYDLYRDGAVTATVDRTLAQANAYLGVLADTQAASLYWRERAVGTALYANTNAVEPPPLAPTIAGAVTVGGTLTITRNAGGGAPATYAEYQGGVATGRTVVAGADYTVVSADIDTGTDVTFRAVNGAGTSLDSNALRVETYIAGPYSDANYYTSTNGLAPTWATFTWSCVFKLITFTGANNETIFCTVPTTEDKGYRAFINVNGLTIVLVTSGGAKLAPTFALSSADDGTTILVHWTYDGTTLRQYVNGAEVGTGTSAAGLFVPDSNSPLCVGRYPWSTGLSGRGEAIASIRGTSTVMTPLQIADDAASIMARTSGLVFPTLPGETIRYVGARLVGTSDWHDSDGDNLTLTLNGTVTVAAL